MQRKRELWLDCRSPLPPAPQALHTDWGTGKPDYLAELGPSLCSEMSIPTLQPSHWQHNGRRGTPTPMTSLDTRSL